MPLQRDVAITKAEPQDRMLGQVQVVNLLPIEPHAQGRVVHFDLVVVPLPCRLACVHARRLHIVDGTRAALEGLSAVIVDDL